MIIRIKNLRLRCIIGFKEWERDKKQDVVLNVEIEFDASQAVREDAVAHGVDYKTLTKQISEMVEGSNCALIETLASRVLDLVMDNPRVERARVEVDKPGALRFTDSVSAEASALRPKRNAKRGGKQSGKSAAKRGGTRPGNRGGKRRTKAQGGA